MKDFGKIIITGRAVETPELKQTQSGLSVTTFTVAQNLAENHSVFFDVTAWRKTAEIVCQYVKKGSQVLVSGQPDMREYTDKNDVKHKKFFITADDITFLGSKEKKDEPQFEQVDVAAENGLPF